MAEAGAGEYRTFVTVGTHEQPFDRLIRAIDECARREIIPAPVFVQAGYSDYSPEHCDWSRFLSADVMARMMLHSELIVTHGGPSSFMEALAAGKTPIVVPRLAKFGEHVNDHQLDFCHAVKDRLGCIVVIDDIADLPFAVEKVLSREAKDSLSNNEAFCQEFSQLVDRLFDCES